MQIKHLIILALVGMAVLLGFNIINGNRHEQNRAIALSNTTSVQSTTISNNKLTNSIDIASQPLGKQPKAIMDNATSQINQAQQIEQERLKQMNNTQ